ncbi:hypothetical protein Bhyg_07377 [Pseudolycoriella hygida]|uniref:Tyr recombinase domain-containing protein n=1 Tax=Pseudolycoriella hygida TaxID=35572 RepID=A0A9Q0N4F6_9DIPT|nr:hypothetical protein Bhyg_07377 [Pseudolycoriella hygida]
MLKATIQRNHNISIEYPKVVAKLKINSVYHRPKKAKIFEDVEIAEFLSEADDLKYLAAKIIVIFGMFGATRCIELTKLELRHIKQHGEVFVVELDATKTDVDRSFVIEGIYAEMVRKYLKLRVSSTPHQRFFVNYQKGICTTQPIGKHKFAGTPKLVADYLQLAESKKYTGHSLRRSSATLLVNGGAGMTGLKHHGGWKSSTVAEGYIGDSMARKRKMGAVISNAIAPKKSSSEIVTECSASSPKPSSSTASSSIATLATASSPIASLATASSSTKSPSKHSGSGGGTTETALVPFDSIDNEINFQEILAESVVPFDDTIQIPSTMSESDIASKMMRSISMEGCKHFEINFNFK